MLKQSKDKLLHIDEDTQLMLKVSGGDTLAFQKIYEKYLPILTGYISKLNGHFETPIEDIAQETLSCLWEFRKRFRVQAKAQTYIFSIARNILSKHNYKNLREKDSLETLFFIQDVTDRTVQDRQFIEIIQKAKSKLSFNQKQALELVFYSKLPQEKAAFLANCQYEAFRHRLYEAKKRLRKLISSELDFKNF